MQIIENIYVHIPFCKNKCKYCSFISTCKLDLIDDYINALIKEVQANYSYTPIKTLYFGGGTPSLLTINQLEKILFLFNTSSETEITFEANPESLTMDNLICYKNMGINRLSIGAQTFDDDILKTIGRLHNSLDIENAVKNAQLAEFNNISLDFIYGLPNQDRTGFKNDLKKAIALEVQHISLYGLKIEFPSKFHAEPPKSLPSDDVQADMYLDALQLMAENSFNHYEISNFAKNDFSSKHNLTYWQNKPYFGFGAAAHGYIDGIRYSNLTPIESYIDMPTKRQYEHKVSPKEHLEEEIFLGFRQVKGINIAKINQEYSIDFNKKYKKIITKFLNSKHLIETKEGYALTAEGILVSNMVLAEFLV